ncbi:MAG: beta-galactosidase [Planctomycetota bacterium]
MPHPRSVLSVPLTLIALLGLALPLTAGEDVETTTSWTFQETEGWQVWWPEDKKGPPPFTTRFTEAGWRVEVEPSKSRIILNGYSSILRKQKLPGLHGLTLRVTNTSEAPAMVHLSFHDSAGERFYLKPRRARPGENTLGWSFPIDVNKTGGKNPDGAVEGDLVFGNLYIERYNAHRAKPLSVTFTGVELNQAVDPMELITADLETGHPLRVVHPDRLEDAQVLLRNASDRPMTVMGELAVRDRPLQEPRSHDVDPVTIPANGSIGVSIPCSLIEAEDGGIHGIRYAQWRFVNAGSKKTIEGESSLAVMDFVGKTPGVDESAFVFGLAGYHAEWSAPDERLKLITDAAANIGVESVRFGTAWRNIEPSRGQWNWEPLDRLVNSAIDAGMEPQLMLAFGGAEWTKPPDSLAQAQADDAMDRQWRYMPRPEYWRQFVRTVAERYQGRVRLWEVWNEPDIGFFRGTTDQYLQLLEIAHEEIKASDPDNIVISGGLAAYSHRDAKHDLYERLLSEAQPHYDYFGYHRHGTFSRLYNEIEHRIIPMRERFSATSKPFYFNETGLAREFEREDEMASSLVKKLTYTWSRGAKGYHWFCMWVPAHRTGAAQGYRMLNSDFSPRPAFVAYNTVARYLRGRQFVKQLDLGEGRFGFLFNGPGHFMGQGASDYVAVVWTEQPGLSPAVFAMDAGGAEKVRVVSVMGDTRQAARLGDRALVHLEREPTLIVFDGASLRQPGSSRRVLTPPPALAMVPGRLSMAEVKFRNPTDATLSMDVEWVTQGAVELEGRTSQSLTLQPGQTLQVGQGVRLSTDTTEYARPPLLTLRWRLGSRGEWNHAAVEIRPALRVTMANPTGRAPDLVLNEARHVINHNDIDPHTQRFMWRGTADLSARAWFWRDGERLGVQLDVTDDHHRQTHPARQMWRGDSLQFGVAVPGRAGFLEFGLARNAAAQSVMHTWSRPQAVPGRTPVRNPSVERLEGRITRYTFQLNLAELTGDAPTNDQPFALSFVINDDDEDRREGFLQLTPGIAGSKDPSLFMPLVLE